MLTFLKSLMLRDVLSQLSKGLLALPTGTDEVLSICTARHRENVLMFDTVRASLLQNPNGTAMPKYTNTSSETKTPFSVDVDSPPDGDKLTSLGAGAGDKVDVAANVKQLPGTIPAFEGEGARKMPNESSSPPSPVLWRAETDLPDSSSSSNASKGGVLAAVVGAWSRPLAKPSDGASPVCPAPLPDSLASSPVVRPASARPIPAGGGSPPQPLYLQFSGKNDPLFKKVGDARACFKCKFAPPLCLGFKSCMFESNVFESGK